MINNFQLSKHFNLREFQCPCCHRVMVDDRLIPVLENVRVHFGGRPVVITSGYRCAEHNKMIGGAIDSDHLHGWAADIVIEGIEPAELARIAAQYLPRGQGRIGTYFDRSCVHIGVQHRKGLPDRWGKLRGDHEA